MRCDNLTQAREQARANCRKSGAPWVIFTDTSGNICTEPQTTAPRDILEIHKPPLIVNGTAYHADTRPEIVRILENLRTNGGRVRLHYGDAETGRDWLDEWDFTGTISRSMGLEKIPLLIASRRSFGGGGILTDCIVRIRQGKRDIYRHPNYHQGTPELIPDTTTANGKQYAARVDINGKTHARFETMDQARRWLVKMGFPETPAPVSL